MRGRTFEAVLAVDDLPVYSRMTVSPLEAPQMSESEDGLDEGLLLGDVRCAEALCRVCEGRRRTPGVVCVDRAGVRSAHRVRASESRGRTARPRELGSLITLRSHRDHAHQLRQTRARPPRQPRSYPLVLVAPRQHPALSSLHRPLHFLSTMGAHQFDSATYLRGLGWAGPGSSLNNSAAGRAKPVTVVQKKTLSGVGRDRDTSFAWWDAVFTSVAKKVTGDKVRPSPAQSPSSCEASPTLTPSPSSPLRQRSLTQTEHHRTSTGILSHRPPPPDGNAYEPLTDSQKTGLNLDAMAAVKLELARRQLYSGFLRGTALSGSGGDDDADKQNNEAAKENALATDEDAAGSSKKRKRDSAAAASGDERAARKEEKRRKKDEDKAAKKAAKAARKGKARADENDEDERASAPVAAVVEETVEVTTTSTPVVEPASASTLLFKEERRAAKKLRKQLEADSASTSTLASLAPSTASSSALPSTSTTPSPTDAPLDADEQAYLEAKAAARRAEKEERRLARAARKAARA